jgi:hypothetical protein
MHHTSLDRANEQLEINPLAAAHDAHTSIYPSLHTHSHIHTRTHTHTHQNSCQVLDVLDTMLGGAVACGAKSFAHALHVIARKRVPAEEKRLVVVLRSCARVVGDLDLRGLSKLYWAVAKLHQAAKSAGAGGDGGVCSAAEALLAAAGKPTADAMPTFDARGVVTVLHAHATAERKPSEVLLAAALARLDQVGDELGSQDVSNCWWAIAKLALAKDGSATERLRSRTVTIAPSLKPQELSMTLWAMGTLAAELDETLTSVLAKATVDSLPSCAPQGVANVAWAWSKLGSAPDEVVDTIASSVTAMAEQFTPQGFSAAVWSCAKLGE